MKSEFVEIQNAIEKALAKVQKQFSDFEISLGAGSGFSSIGFDTRVVVKLVGTKPNDATIKKSKKFFKQYGKRLGMCYKEYRKARFNYDGEHFELVGMNKKDALVKSLSRNKTRYFVIDLKIVKIAIASFRKEIGK